MSKAEIKAQINNEIKSLWPTVERARQQVVYELKQQKVRNDRETALKYIEILQAKRLRRRVRKHPTITRYILSNPSDWDEIINDQKSEALFKNIARIAKDKILVQKIAKFKSQFPNYAAYLGQRIEKKEMLTLKEHTKWINAFNKINNKSSTNACHEDKASGTEASKNNDESSDNESDDNDDNESEDEEVTTGAFVEESRDSKPADRGTDYLSNFLPKNNSNKEEEEYRNYRFNNKKFSEQQNDRFFSQVNTFQSDASNNFNSYDRSYGMHTPGSSQLPGRLNDRLNNRPNNSFNDRPNNRFNDRPNNTFNDRPNNRFNDRPNNRFNNRPNNRFHDRPNSRFNERPNNRFNNRPNNRFNDRPDNRFNNRPDNRFNNGPDNRFNNKPDNRFNSGPDIRFNNRPDNRFNNGPDNRFNEGSDSRFNGRPNNRFNDRPNNRFNDRPNNRFNNRPNNRLDNDRNEIPYPSW